MLTTDQKGVIAELAIAHHAADLGIGVWHAYTVERYDLIFDLRNQLVRVQCKWASRHGDVLVVRCCSHRRNRDGLVRRRYEARRDRRIRRLFSRCRALLLPSVQSVRRPDIDTASPFGEQEQPAPRD